VKLPSHFLDEVLSGCAKADGKKKGGKKPYNALFIRQSLTDILKCLRRREKSEREKEKKGGGKRECRPDCGFH